MKKFINNPDDLTAELLEGLAMAYPQTVKLESEKLVCRATPKSTDKVALLTLGGAGHEPALQGWVGPGMLDIAVVGDIWAAPGPVNVLEAMQMLKRDAGTLLVTLNHSGDVMCADMAKEMAELEGITVKEVLTTEEIRPTAEEEGRGLGGCLIICKVAGAAAERGMDLDQVYRIADKVNSNMGTIAVLSEIATHPSTGDECGEMGDDEMEICAGQHGEGGGVRMDMKSAKDTADLLSQRIIDRLGLAAGDEILLIVNGSGKTTMMEMLITFADAAKYFEAKGISVVRGRTGEFLTVQEAAGYQMIACKLDDEIRELWDAPCDTPFFTVA
ncbi:MAG: dihydroxyacetone kinase subunit DhaK [Lentisphaerae bacterium]|jgi:phosphoenolpyruvate---glycerone phosphotransferase subunit DhaK|nr:dihydroxyacetone kinase subunit DhaK [Lentisphaerota bacterium]MBT4817876.1 dihydroxyacetone kinase subunit DhaK [Lentisphaerota bacterium]MBT5612550.1 dihydroxyacetone kinase subunit DhaK [Lentisphaerota bacterium]MBT7061345.1 dihydroxyacetone kinase subunit DhaK [Lentisphaerota bacterium]MBT7840486.1 dihydroxyacetone kinase subunit DhaK [Lentisphaerota bacterium]